MPQAIPAVLAALQTAANFVIGAAASATFAVTGSAAAAAAVSNFVAGAVTLGAAGAGVAGAAGALVGTAALSGAISAMAPKPPVARAQLQTTAGTLGPRKWVVGRCGLGGHSLTPTPMQSASGKIATVAYAVGGVGPVGTLEGLWFGDDFVTFQPNGVANGKWSAALGCVSNVGSWSNTALTLPSNHPAEWTAAHRGDGCGMALFWIRTEAKEFQRNSPQTPRFLRRGELAYVLDPRTGAQATYASGGFNRACVAYTFCRGIYRNGQLIMGLGLSDAEIDLPAYQYWATVCDTNGWRLAGEISAGDDRNETLKAICFGGGAIPVTRAGKESVIVSAPGVSVATITDDDWVDLPLLESKVETFALPNTIIPRFSHEPARFDVVDGSQVAPAAWLEADGGIERTATVEVPWCTWATQAAQIAAYGGYNDREPLKLTGRLKASRRYDVFPGDCFTWQSAELGTSIKFKLVGFTAIGEDLSVTILAETETDAKHALALGTTTTPAPRQALPPFDPAAVPQPADGIWSLTAAEITAGDTVLPVLRVTRSAGELDTLVTQVIVRHRLNGATGWLSEYLLDASALSVEIGEVTPSTAYQVGVWYVNANGATSASPRIIGPVTTGALVAGTAASVPWDGLLLPDGTPVPTGRIDNQYGDFSARLSWRFAASTLGWVGDGATVGHVAGDLTAVGRLFATSSNADPILQVFTGFPNEPLRSGKVRARVRCTSHAINTIAWNGEVFFSTAAHGTGLYSVTVPRPSAAQDEWVVLEWNMQGVAGTDFSTAAITSLRLDLAAQSGVTFEVEWIAIGDTHPDPVGVRGIKDLADRTGINTAAAIAGQADWATYTGIDTTDMAGRVFFLNPATGELSSVTRITDRRLTLLRRADGSTDVTEFAVVTSLGTAAAIAGQAPAATDATIEPGATVGARLGFNFRLPDNSVAPVSRIDNRFGDFSARWAWRFSTGTLGWTGDGATVGHVGGDPTTVGRLFAVSTNSDPIIQVATGLPTTPLRSGRVRARIRCTSHPFSAIAWDGTVFFSTAAHGTGTFFVSVPRPNAAQDDWTVLEWDMLSATGSDFATAALTSLRLDLAAQTGVTIEVEWIAIGDSHPDPVGIRGITDLADRTAVNTAAAIAGQADWATYTGIDTSDMAGRVFFMNPSTGELAGLNRVTDRRLNLLRRADGTTDVTEGAVVTSLGTAAAIAGQAPAATDATIQAGATRDVGADTRSDDFTPMHYRSNWLRRLREEFKFRTTIGAPSGATGVFGVLRTITPWEDPSGGPVTQEFTDEAGRRFVRYSTGSTGSETWTAWQPIYSGNRRPFFGSDLLEADGGAVATLAGFKTSLGTAAAIAGQAPAATDFTIEAGADVTATATRTIAPQFPVIEIRQGEAGHTGSRTVTHTIRRGTTTLTGGTWSLPSINLTGATVTINGSTGTVTISGVTASGAYTIRYTHTDGIPTDLPVNVTYLSAAASGGGRIARSTDAVGVASGTYATVLSATINDAAAGLAEVALQYSPTSLTGSSTSFQMRLTRAGVQVAEGAAFTGIDSAGDPTSDWFSAVSELQGYYTSGSGTALWALQIRRTSGSGTVSVATGEIVINQQPT